MTSAAVFRTPSGRYRCECPLSNAFLSSHLLIECIPDPRGPRGYCRELTSDKKSIEVNDSLTLGGIPPEVFEYSLGNRSAIEWVIDQYRVKEDKRSGIRSDPNKPYDPDCEAFDVDFDGDVDLSDFALFQEQFTGVQ